MGKAFYSMGKTFSTSFLTMIQNEMQSHIGSIEGRQGVIGTLSVGWGEARGVWEGFLYYREKQLWENTLPEVASKVRVLAGSVMKE